MNYYYLFYNKIDDEERNELLNTINLKEVFKVEDCINIMNISWLFSE